MEIIRVEGNLEEIVECVSNNILRVLVGGREDQYSTRKKSEMKSFLKKQESKCKWFELGPR